MICEVRGVFPTVPNNARSVRGRRRAAGGGTRGGAHPRAPARAHAHSGTHTRSLPRGRRAGALAPGLARASPTHTHIYVFLPRKKV